MNPETKIQNSIRLALSQAGHTSWRNETGRFWTGRVVHKEGQLVTLSSAQMISLGLCKGSADIVGIQKGTGRFFAIEVKTKTGRASDEQKQFLEHVRLMGGIAGVARTVEEALELVS